MGRFIRNNIERAELMLGNKCIFVKSVICDCVSVLILVRMNIISGSCL